MIVIYRLNATIINPGFPFESKMTNNRPRDFVKLICFPVTLPLKREYANPAHREEGPGIGFHLSCGQRFSLWVSSIIPLLMINNTQEVFK